MENKDWPDDLLEGVEAIAAFTGWSKRRVYHLAEKGKLPLFKVGDRTWYGRKSTLRRHIESLEANHV
jgi:hypothetical protein